MSLMQSGWRPLVASVAAFLSLLTNAALAEKTASISGYVYLDYNGNNVIDPLVDYAIRFAKVTLKRDADPSFSVDAYTDGAGRYVFDDISTSGGGTFSLVQSCYTCTDGVDTVGSLLDQNGVAVNASLFGTAHNSADDPLKNQITGIALQAGYTGVNYNFGEKTFPLELISKRMFMDLGTPDPVPQPVPEPASLTLALAFVGLLVGAIIRRRVRG